MKKKLLIVAVCFVVVSAIGITFMTKSRGSDDINLIEPEATEEPAEEKKPFPGISVLNDPEWVIRNKDAVSVASYKPCEIRNEYIDNPDPKLECEHWCSSMAEGFNALEDESGNIYIKVDGSFGTSEERKNPTQNTIIYVRLLADDEAEQILDSDEIENITPEEIYILKSMLAMYNGQTLIRDQYINNIGYCHISQDIYFTKEKAIRISTVWLSSEGKELILPIEPYYATMSYEIEIIPEDSYILNNGIKKNHVYRFSGGPLPDYNYIPPDWAEVCSGFPYLYINRTKLQEYIDSHPDAKFSVPGY